jgi:hypothetical protein
LRYPKRQQPRHIPDVPHHTCTQVDDYLPTVNILPTNTTNRTKQQPDACMSPATPSPPNQETSTAHTHAAAACHHHPTTHSSIRSPPNPEAFRAPSCSTMVLPRASTAALQHKLRTQDTQLLDRIPACATADVLQQWPGRLLKPRGACRCGGGQTLKTS